VGATWSFFCGQLAVENHPKGIFEIPLWLVLGLGHMDDLYRILQGNFAFAILLGF